MIDSALLNTANRRVLGRAITLIESNKPEHREQADKLIQEILPQTGKSKRIGITGAPGVGKSTFIEALGNYVIQQGHKVAVLTVDPSSSLTGGSILGDKTRMETLAVNPNAFIRPTPAGDHLGGVSRRTNEAILICEAAGFDVILIETVGVGQSETLVAEMTDLFMLLLLPGSGDDLQGIKRGIMELSDLIVVNKADHSFQDQARRTAADITNSLHLIKPRLEGWEVPVQLCSAIEKVGIDEIWKSVERYFPIYMGAGGLLEKRKVQAKRCLWKEVNSTMMDYLTNNIDMKKRIEEIESAVQAAHLTPSMAAKQLVREFLEVKL